ncbi:hypothetical protein [Aquimarina algicola]|uniref:Uncharacterized protein n=1 Tax=Aquimarina algicola TaxID=2589995 RepID=A0A504JG06_9FLAO|nr:hypothetical protein [Aquimarina algicola]TPN87395.1 hypothetical protein FHK87_07365 [Aquimarina algicola]
MRTTYERFKELREKAQDKLKGHGILKEQLKDAVLEINLMEEYEVPKYKLELVQSIIKSCLTHKPEGDQGIIGTSINKMTYAQLKSLKRSIELL